MMTDLVSMNHTEERFQVFKDKVKDITLFWADRAHEEFLNLHFFRGKALLKFKEETEQEFGETLSKDMIIRLSKELGLEGSASTLYKEMKFAEMFGHCTIDDGIERLDLVRLQAEAQCNMTWRSIALYGIREHKNMERRLTDGSPDVISCNTLQGVILDARPYMVQFVSKSGVKLAQYIIDEFKGEN
jgi:hypothetical protein